MEGDCLGLSKPPRDTKPGDPDQLLKDCLAGIIRDWTCISACVASPWDGQESFLNRSYYLRRIVELKLRCKPRYDSLLIAAIMDYEEYLVHALVDHRSYDLIIHHKLDQMFPQSDVLQLQLAQIQAYQQNPVHPLPPGIAFGPWPLNLDAPRSPRKRRRALAASKLEALLNQDGESSTAKKPKNVAFTGPQRIHHYVRTGKPTKRWCPHPSRLPLIHTPGKSFVQYLSQLIPRSFDLSKRSELVNILRTGNPKVPSCWVYMNGKSQRLFRGTLRDNLRTLPELPKVVPKVTMSSSLPTAASAMIWPGTSIPVEIFKSITSYLPHEDIHSLRLVNRHFEQSVSECVFRTVVVPFRPEIYGMVMASRESHQPQHIQGKDKAVAGQAVGGNGDFSDASFGDAPFGIYDRGLAPGAVINGMKVFQGWGPHIKRFGFAFEVDEVILKNPPKKDTRDYLPAFYGRYNWPHRNYSRFALMAGLEKAADKTGDMTQALGNLSNMTELSLSLDGGLGWINGPDISDRAQIFSQKSKVYGVQNSVLDRAALGRLWRWGKISGKIKPVLSRLAEDPSIDQLALTKYVEILSNAEVLHERALEFIGRYMKSNPVGHLKRLLKAGHSDQSNQQILDEHVQKALCNAGVIAHDDRSTATKSYGIEDLLRRKKMVFSSGKPHVQELGQNSNCSSRFWIEIKKKPCPMIIYSAAFRAIKAGNCALGAYLVNGSNEPYIPDRHDPFSGLYISGGQSMDDMNATDESPHDSSSDVDNRAIGDVVQKMLGNQATRGEIEEDWSNVLASNLTDDGVDSSGLEGPPMIFHGININNLPDATPTTIGHEPNKLISSAPLQPRFLTTPQTEWLLETEWAQRAFLSSYILAAVDNRSTFENVTTLNFSKLSSRYLTLLDRPDLWEALQHLHTVTLMVSPDWRDVKQQHPGLVETTSLAPSLAVDPFLNVLRHHVSPRKAIKTLVVGYIGGGEHATGMFARNQHVLPAPIIDSSKFPRVLELPHVCQLTFINCWFAPGVLTTFMNDMKKKELRTIKLSSVSLIATDHAGSAIPQTPQTTANTTTQAQPTWKNVVAAGMGFGVPLPRPRGAVVPATIASNATDTGTEFGWINSDVRQGTWGSFIDDFTPADNLAELRSAQKAPGDGSPPPERGLRSVVRLEFDSCGYVLLPHQYEGVMSVPGGTYAEPKAAYLISRHYGLSRLMMTSDDSFLGCIYPHILRDEVDVLTNAFHMRLGWGKDPKRFLNREDGQPEGGTGRFSGIIQGNTEQQRLWDSLSMYD